ncbi:MAG: YciI family protein [Gemmatimonadota bacterium]|nr:YciI family protein [Gemmatimonadota bacterium]
MKYMLMMNAPRGTGDYQISSWSPDDLEAHMAFMHRLNKELTESGELVGGEGLTPPGQAKLVRAGKNGVPVVTDGPFPEAKEFLAGYWIVDVDRPERAYEIAAKASAAPGPGGKPLILPIEVRQVMSVRPAEV